MGPRPLRDSNFEFQIALPFRTHFAVDSSLIPPLPKTPLPPTSTATISPRAQWRLGSNYPTARATSSFPLCLGINKDTVPLVQKLTGSTALGTASASFFIFQTQNSPALVSTITFWVSAHSLNSSYGKAGLKIWKGLHL
ncbi:hypothetical protein ACLB2K_044546 [Fragaria x ananassa]